MAPKSATRRAFLDGILRVLIRGLSIRFIADNSPWIASGARVARIRWGRRLSRSHSFDVVLGIRCGLRTARQCPDLMGRDALLRVRPRRSSPLALHPFDEISNQDTTDRPPCLTQFVVPVSFGKGALKGGVSRMLVMAVVWVAAGCAATGSGSLPDPFIGSVNSYCGFRRYAPVAGL